jgi:hypothetical protein
MLDLMNFDDIDEVLYSSYIDDDYKLRKMEQLFGEEITPDNVEFLFKKWRANNLKSSNVRKILYNDETQEMFIQFQDKSIYTYFNVSFDLFLKVSGGEATCITSGENKYGSWYVGKTPSNGAAVWKWLRDANVPYKKGGSLE